MKPIPEWFKKDLKMVDENYFVVYNQFYDYFEIKRRIHIHYFKERTKKWAEVNHLATVGVFKVLNTTAIDSLLKRKKIGLKFNYKENPKKYWDWVAKQEKEARQKAKDMAIDHMTEGVIRIENIGKSQLYDMGG